MSAGFHYWCQAGWGELVIKDGKAYLTKLSDQRLLYNRSSRSLSRHCMRTVSLWASSWLQALRSPPTANCRRPREMGSLGGGTLGSIWKSLMVTQEGQAPSTRASENQAPVMVWVPSILASVLLEVLSYQGYGYEGDRERITTGIESLMSSPRERLHRPSKPAFLLYLSSDHTISQSAVFMSVTAVFIPIVPMCKKLRQKSGQSEASLCYLISD